MADLNNLKDIVNEKLRDVTMTEKQKERVREAVQQKPQQMPQRRRSRYTWPTTAAAAILAVVLLTSSGIPQFRDGNPAATTTVTESVGGSANSSTDSTTAQTTQAIDVASQLEIVALDEGEGGVKADSSFLIRSNVAVSLTQLAAMITLKPDIEFTLEEQGEREFLLKPDSPLAQNTLLNICVSDEEDELLRSWAFQTGDELRVVSTLPGDGTRGMPLNTGIEITFSEEVTEAEPYFTISPAVSGHFESNGSTLVFVPDEDLQEDTIYQITIGAGITAVNGDSLAQDYCFAFRTPADYNDQLYLLDSFTESYLPQDTTVITVNATEGYKERDFLVEVYRLNSVEEYLELAEKHEAQLHPVLGRNNDVLLDVSGYERVLSFETQLYRQEHNWWHADHIVFPETPEIGWYLTQITVEGTQTGFQKLIQISPISVYTQSINGETLLWVNDSQTGDAVSGAQITLSSEENTVQCVTDAQGVAVCNLDAQQAQLCIEAGANYFGERLALTESQETPLADQYYALVYTDRAAYLPSDTLHFWGKLIPKTESAVLPENLDIYSDSMESSRLMSVELTQQGTFSGEISFTNQISGSHDLLFASSGEQITSAWYTISDYAKPVYLLDVETDKEVYGPGETVNVTVTGTFYDGTPAQGLEIQIHHDLDVNGNYGTSGLVLDSNGMLRYSFVPGHRETSWMPSYSFVSCNTASAEDVWVGAGTNIRIFYGDRMLNVENIAEPGGVQASITVNELLIDRYQVDMDTQEMQETLAGEPAEVSGIVEIRKCGYVRQETGAYYDHISKQNVKLYDYSYAESTLASYAFTTDGGKWVSPLQMIPEDVNSWYRIEVSYNNSQDGPMKETMTVSTQKYPVSSGSYCFYADSALNMRLDEEKTLTLVRDSEVVTEGRMLVSLTQDRILRSDVQEAGKYVLRYTQDAIPDMYVVGAYFDGAHVYAIPATHVRYDVTEQELHINIIPDQGSYAPGDTMDVTLEVMDEAGRPVIADLVLSVADNAALAILEPTFEPLPLLYTAYGFQHPVTYSSYRDRDSIGNGMAEGGGGEGGEGVRDDFEDTAAFMSAQTDPQGRARLKVRLPDNLTSWRLSVVAVEDHSALPQAGMESLNVVATLPFFVNAVVGDTCLAQDDLSLSLRAAGTAILGSDAAVEYTVELSGNGQMRKEHVGGNPSSFTFLNLGKLPEGIYTLTIRARCGDYEDAIRQTVEVVSSRHELVKYTYADLKEGLEVSSLRYPVTVQFYDREQQELMRTIGRAMVANSRLDGMMATLISHELLEGETSINGLSAYSNLNGGLNLFTYGVADAEVTAQAVVARASWFDEAAVKGYLYRVLEDRDSTSAQVAAAYMGLAIWKEPVLRDVRLLLDEEDAMSVADKLYLVTALALLGDDAGVNEWLSQNQQALSAEKDDNVLYTCLCRLLTLAVVREDAEMTQRLLREVVERDNAYISPAFALATYLSRVQPPEKTAAVISYTVDGERRELTFDTSWIQSMKLSENELLEADFRVEKGEVSYRLSYTDTLTEDTGDGDVQLQQQFETQEATVGDLVKLTLKMSGDEVAEVGTLSAVIPSGMRYVSLDGAARTSGCYLLEEENGRLKFRLSGHSTYTINLYVRCVLPGDYYAEAPTFADEMNGTFTVGTGTQVTIHEKN